MKTWVHRLASMRIGVVLLVLIIVALAAGTIIESAHGTEAAARIVYYSAWFQIVLGLFALNVLLSLVDLWPWGRQRIGFIMTHAAMLLVLAGALVTDQLKVEGRLAIWEGERSARFTETLVPGEPGPPRLLALPFEVQLDAFEIDYYPGTRRPAMFRSRVTVHDPAAAAPFPAVIEMNRELAFSGYRLYQSSYQQTPERDQTVLQVSRDPGQPLVFAGYILLMIGMTTVLLTRVAQRRALARVAAMQAARPVRRAAAVVAGIGLLLGVAGTAAAAPVPNDAAVEQLRRLPVQHDGRVMPLDTLAREAIWRVTGRRGHEGHDPVALVVGWSIDPRSWAGVPLVRLPGRDLAAAIGLPPGSPSVSFDSLVRNQRLMDLIREAGAEQAGDRALHGLLKDAQTVEERLVWMQGFLSGESVRAVPPPGDPNERWSAPGPIDSTAALIAVARSGRAEGLVSAGAIEREIAYNRARPARLAWWILAAATAAAIAAWTRPRRLFDGLAIAGLLAGFAVMTWGLWTRWLVAGRIPASNMYESLLFLGWGVGLFAVVAILFLRNRLLVLNATAMSALTMALCDRLPIDPFIHPMPPVLSGTPWLAIHVPIIMVSYSVLALGVLVAHMQIGVAIFAPRNRDLAFRMNDMLYWYTHVGSILLIAGILTGSIWAASSWGRYWGWDPKEVWSLIAFLAYVAILHGRFDRWIGTFGVAALSIVAFWTILMTYIGVNFVLTAGLHSYGFGGGAVVRWMMIVAALEALYVGVGYLAHTTVAQAPEKGATAPA